MKFAVVSTSQLLMASPTVTPPSNPRTRNRRTIHGVRQEIPDRRIASRAERISDLDFMTDIISRIPRKGE